MSDVPLEPPITTADVDPLPIEEPVMNPDDVIHTGNTEPVPEEDRSGEIVPDEVVPQRTEKAGKEASKK